MTPDDLERFLGDQNRSQRERLTLLASDDWRAGFAGLSDDDLLVCLRLIRKKINSKKLVGPRDELLGELRRDGLDGAAALPKPTPPPPVTVDVTDIPESPATASRNLELEAVVAADPRARDAYLVVRDWLEGRGLVTDGRVHLGELANCDDMLTEVDWHLGFIRGCHLRYTSARFNGDKPQVRIEDALHWLLDDPGPGRFVQKLTVGLVRHDDNNYGGVCRAIAAHPRHALMSLFLGDFGYEECELNWSEMGDAAPMWPALPRLRSLTLRAGDINALGTIELPELRRFETITGGLGADGAKSIASASWPQLETMSVQVGPEGVSDASVVDPILDARGLPSLKHLGLLNANFTDAICVALPSSKILPQLEVLDLSMGSMGAEGARAIADNASAFAHLRMIHLDDNYLDADAIASLAGICPMHIGDQREDHGARYGSTYE